MTSTQIQDLNEMLKDLIKLRSSTKEIFKILSKRDTSNLTNSTSQTLYSASNSLEDFKEKFTRPDIQKLIQEKNQQNKIIQVDSNDEIWKENVKKNAKRVLENFDDSKKRKFVKLDEKYFVGFIKPKYEEKMKNLKEIIDYMITTTGMEIAVTNMEQTDNILNVHIPNLMKFEITFRFYDDFIEVLYVFCEGSNKSKNAMVFQAIKNSILEFLNETAKVEIQYKKKQLQSLLFFIASFSRVFEQKCMKCDKILLHSNSTWRFTPSTHRIIELDEMYSIHDNCKQK
eukprot:gene11128-3947_t